MKKFNFELEKILEYRNFEKQQAEAELAKAIAVENQINENLKTIAAQYLASKKEMEENLNIDDILSLSRYNKLLDYQKEELLNQLAQAKLVTSEKREILAEIMKKTTALEKLKEKEEKTYREEMKAEEKKFLDDLANKKRNII